MTNGLALLVVEGDMSEPDEVTALAWSNSAASIKHPKQSRLRVFIVALNVTLVAGLALSLALTQHGASSVSKQSFSITVAAAGAESTLTPSGFSILGIRVDNPSGMWVYIPEIYSWAPPYSMGFAYNPDVALTSIKVRQLAAPTGGRASAVTGGPIIVVLYDAAIATQNSDNFDLVPALQQLSTDLGTTHTDLVTVNTTLGTVKTSVDTVNTTLTTTNTKLDTLNTTLSTVKTSVDTVNTTLSTTNTKLDTLNTTMGTVKTSVDGVNTTLGTTNTRLTTLDTDLNALTTALNNLKGGWGSTPTLLSVNIRKPIDGLTYTLIAATAGKSIVVVYAKVWNTFLGNVAPPGLRDIVEWQLFDGASTKAGGIFGPESPRDEVTFPPGGFKWTIATAVEGISQSNNAATNANGNFDMIWLLEYYLV